MALAIVCSWALAAPLRAADGAGQRLVHEVAWEVISYQVRDGVARLLVEAPAGETEPGEAWLEGARRTFVETPEADVDTSNSPVGPEVLLERLEERRSVWLDSRQPRGTRRRALLEMVQRFEQIYRWLCCTEDEAGLWDGLLEAEFPRQSSEADRERWRRVAGDLVARYPELSRVDARFIPDDEGPLAGQRPCEAPGEASPCVQRDLLLAGYRLALLLEESFATCRPDAEKDLVCLPYVGETASSCLRALPLEWAAVEAVSGRREAGGGAAVQDLPHFPG